MHIITTLLTVLTPNSNCLHFPTSNVLSGCGWLATTKYTCVHPVLSGKRMLYAKIKVQRQHFPSPVIALLEDIRFIFQRNVQQGCCCRLRSRCASSRAADISCALRLVVRATRDDLSPGGTTRPVLGIRKKKPVSVGRSLRADVARGRHLRRRLSARPLRHRLRSDPARDNERARIDLHPSAFTAARRPTVLSGFAPQNRRTRESRSYGQFRIEANM